ncbi:MYG1 protein C27H6.8 [Sitodiplosis mosellana]|uniref:MYG1 protein C27H6.8 n=1 Tax=Sitodiplosis mosellana TaxID=263140 RepID=UPI002445016E|nr:MYG1 protein C27H6.8 [Sitodiplosis mosellana]
MLRRFFIHNSQFVKHFESTHLKSASTFRLSTEFNRQFRRMSSASGDVLIGTHNGMFHCDEILACYMLQQLPKYENARIVRSRDADVLKDCDIVIDVGSVFDPETFRFDHHQKTFDHTLGSLRPEFVEKFSTVRLSSAGLIYTHFGEEVISRLVKRLKGVELSDECLRSVFEKVYEYFIQEIDGIDNGVPQFAGEPVYRISTHLSSRVGHFNSQWNSAEDYDEQAQFEKAKELVGSEFVDSVLYYATTWWPARAIVSDAIKKRFDLHPSGKIIELEQFCPWKQHLYDLEKVEKCEGEILYCIMASSPGDHRVICVPKTANSFLCRKFLPPSWRGIRDEAVAAVSGVTDAKFVHATGFIGGGKTRDAVLEMAIISTESTEEEPAK